MSTNSQIEEAINEIKVEYDNKKKSLNEFIQECAKKYELDNQKFKLHMQRLKQENERIDEVARDREHQLQLISNPEGVKEYKDLLKKFNEYIAKNQIEKQVQLDAMNSMLGIMKDCKLEVPKTHYAYKSLGKKTVSKSKLQQLMKAQSSLSNSFREDKDGDAFESFTNMTPTSRNLPYHKLKSAEVFQDEQISIDSDVDEEIKITENRLRNIAKKSVFRKPNMLEDDIETESKVIRNIEDKKAIDVDKDDEVRSEDIERAIK